jgi:hypothetical protein
MCRQNKKLHEGIQMVFKQQAPLEEDIMSWDINKDNEETHASPSHTKKSQLLSY